MSEPGASRRLTIWSPARRTVGVGAGLEDQAVDGLVGDHPLVDLAVGRRDEGRPVARGDVAAGLEDRGEEVVAREAAGHPAEVGPEGLAPRSGRWRSPS